MEIGPPLQCSSSTLLDWRSQTSWDKNQCKIPTKCWGNISRYGDALFLLSYVCIIIGVPTANYSHDWLTRAAVGWDQHEVSTPVRFRVLEVSRFSAADCRTAKVDLEGVWLENCGRRPCMFRYLYRYSSRCQVVVKSEQVNKSRSQFVPLYLHLYLRLSTCTRTCISDNCSTCSFHFYSRSRVLQNPDILILPPCIKNQPPNNQRRTTHLKNPRHFLRP